MALSLDGYIHNPVAEVAEREVGHMTHVKIKKNNFYLCVLQRKYSKIAFLTLVIYMLTIKLTLVKDFAGGYTSFLEHCAKLSLT